MENSYSQEVVNYVRENYKNVVNSENFISISIGGSVARGYAVEGSDIDLICISDKVLQYKKVFKKTKNIMFEIHIIPIDYIYTLIPRVSKYILFDNQIEVTTSDTVNMGAKKCNIISKEDDDFTRLLSAWRELKKIVDSIILYEDSGKFLTELKKQFKNVTISNEIFELFNKNSKNYSNIDIVINSLKLYSLLQKDVFSKVMWTDVYLDEKYNPKVKSILNQIFNEMNINGEKFFIWKNTNINYLLQVHASIKCSFCKDDYLQCNIMRCIIDYMNDIEKAKKNNMKYGKILSIKKCLEYIEVLFQKVNIYNPEFLSIKKDFEINDDKVYEIYDFIKKEYSNKWK